MASLHLITMSKIKEVSSSVGTNGVPHLIVPYSGVAVVGQDTRSIPAKCQGVSANVKRAVRVKNKEFLQFLSIARGSLSELDTQMRLATDFGCCRKEELVNSNINDVFGL